MPTPVALSDSDARARWSRGLPFLTTGAASVTIGGIAAAVTGPTGWEDGSWVAAFLVLVVGVGQIGLGVGQAFLAAEIPTARAVAIEFGLWNAGSLAVLAGTVIETPVIVSLGGVALVGALSLLAHAVRGVGHPHEWTRRTYKSLVLLLLVSVPIGLVLSWLRS